MWKERENCGAKQPLPSVHKCACVPVRTRPTPLGVLACPGEEEEGVESWPGARWEGRSVISGRT